MSSASTLPIGSSTGTTAAATTVTNPKSTLTSSDFINLLVTQLQNQDPTQPMSSADMLQQVSQIGTLQSQEQLSTSLQTMTLQNQVSSAASMIGKSVTGTDTNGNAAAGNVTSIQVQNNSVFLQLDSGSQVSLSNVTTVKAATATASAAAASAVATNVASAVSAAVPVAGSSATASGVFGK
jgi:flagellar basal-body rod modification protein FlgD